MKNILIALVTIGVPALAGINTVNGQTKAYSDIPERGKNIIEIEKTMTPVKNNLSSLDDISSKAIKDFAKTYKNAEAVRWTRTKDGFYVNFISDNVRNRVYYGTNGKWFGSLKSYSEEELPQKIRDIVKSKYYDFSIYFVEELEIIDSNGVPTYLIHLEDKKSLKLIRVFDGEMEAWKEYKKG